MRVHTNDFQCSAYLWANIFLALDLFRFTLLLSFFGANFPATDIPDQTLAFDKYDCRAGRGTMCASQLSALALAQTVSFLLLCFNSLSLFLRNRLSLSFMFSQLNVVMQRRCVPPLHVHNNDKFSQ